VVAGVELRRVRLPLVAPWRWPGGTLTERDVVVVRAVGEESDGWGECAAFPTPSYSPEWVDGAWDVLRHHLVPLALGGPMAASSLPLAAVQGQPMAKCALELAVLDAELRAAGVSLAARLGATRRRVAAGVAIGLTGDLAALLAEVAQFVALGYRRVKLKIEPGWDVEPVRAVRSAFPDLALQVDANGTYQLGDADRLAALNGAGLLCLEQPLAADDLLGHAAWGEKWGGKRGPPLCLDESVTSAAVAATAIALGAGQVINIKAPRVGGYLEAVRVHDLCAAHGIPVWCGGMLETGLGRHANLALAALPNFTLPGDLSASDRFYRDDITDAVVVDPDGTIAVPDGPGTGAELRWDVLDGATVDRCFLAAR
jgi:O-succinylbenzoate synthase